MIFVTKDLKEERQKIKARHPKNNNSGHSAEELVGCVCRSMRVT
jgi:hypothetical protein